MDIQAYLSRIGYKGSLEPNIGTLKGLVKAHQNKVPVENLDIHRNIPFFLDPDAQFDKIVRCKRGGLCFEVNSLFYRLLDKLGFETAMISARHYNYIPNNFGPEYDHMAILVHVHQILYLVDVGYHKASFFPLELDFAKSLYDGDTIYRMKLGDMSDIILMRVENHTAKPLYVFTQTPRKLREFEGMSKYHQTNPDSMFMKDSICTLPTWNGRMTLKGNMYTLIFGEGVIELEIESEEELKKTLKKDFGIVLQYTRQ